MRQRDSQADSPDCKQQGRHVRPPAGQPQCRRVVTDDAAAVHQEDHRRNSHPKAGQHNVKTQRQGHPFARATARAVRLPPGHHRIADTRRRRPVGRRGIAASCRTGATGWMRGGASPPRPSVGRRAPQPAHERARMPRRMRTSGEVVGRLVTRHPHRGEEPRVILTPHETAPGGTARRNADDEAKFAQRAGRHPQRLTRVGQVPSASKAAATGWSGSKT